MAYDDEVLTTESVAVALKTALAPETRAPATAVAATLFDVVNE